MSKKQEVNNADIFNGIPQDVLKEMIESDRRFADDIFEYELPDALADVEYPLSMKEKKELSKFNIKNIDAEENFDDLVYKLAKLREIEEETIDSQKYHDLGIWVRKICYGTFNLKKAVKK